MSQEHESAETILSKAKVQLDIERSYVDSIRQHDFIKNLRKLSLSQEAWLEYGAERYLSAQPFIPLLKKAIAYAKTEIIDDNLVSVLQDNYEDEMGISKPDEGTHEEWRLDFYHALGINEESLKSSSLSMEGKAYSKALVRVGDSPFHAIGAIHYLEVTIPFEFNAVLRACEKSFPNKFKLDPNDTSDMRAEKSKARRYLYDHIVHDMKEHFFDLKRALTPHLALTKSKVKILEGMNIVAEAKLMHMGALNEKFFKERLTILSEPSVKYK